MFGEQCVELCNQLMESVCCVFDFFVGVVDVKDGFVGVQGGFVVVVIFLQKLVFEGECEKVVDVLMKIINSLMWELW